MVEKHPLAGVVLDINVVYVQFVLHLTLATHAEKQNTIEIAAVVVPLSPFTSLMCVRLCVGLVILGSKKVDADRWSVLKFRVGAQLLHNVTS